MCDGEFDACVDDVRQRVCVGGVGDGGEYVGVELVDADFVDLYVEEMLSDGGHRRHNYTPTHTYTLRRCNCSSRVNIIVQL